MRITLEIKCPACLSDSIKKNGTKVDGKQNYQCKICRRQFIGDHALSYQGCHSGIKTKILHLMVRGSGVRDIAEIERVSIGKVLRTLSQSKYQLRAQQSHYETLEVDEFWTFVGHKQNKQWLIYAYHRETGEIVAEEGTVLDRRKLDEIMEVLETNANSQIFELECTVIHEPV